VSDALLGAPSVPIAAVPRAALLAFIARFQQTSGPATAKGVEDTALYRYVPLASLNEVGGEPGAVDARRGRPTARRERRTAGALAAAPARRHHPRHEAQRRRARPARRAERGAGALGRERRRMAAASPRAEAEGARPRRARREHGVSAVSDARRRVARSGHRRRARRRRARRRRCACRAHRARRRVHAQGGARGEAAHELDRARCGVRGRPEHVRARGARGGRRRRVSGRDGSAGRADRARPGDGTRSRAPSSISPRPAPPICTRATSSGTTRSSIPTTAAGGLHPAHPAPRRARHGDPRHARPCGADGGAGGERGRRPHQAVPGSHDARAAARPPRTVHAWGPTCRSRPWARAPTTCSPSRACTTERRRSRWSRAGAPRSRPTAAHRWAAARGATPGSSSRPSSRAPLSRSAHRPRPWSGARGERVGSAGGGRARRRPVALLVGGAGTL
jgi:hypothetical protein